MISSLVLGALDAPMLSKKALQQLLGQFPHPWMHRRELSCIFFKSYEFVHLMSESEVRRLPVLVAEELVVAGLFLGLSSSNIRWPVSNRISSTDATLERGGTETYTLPVVANCLYKLAVQKGEYVRLDWAATGLPAPTSTMTEMQPRLRSIMMAHRWKATRSYRFSEVSHVNL